MRPRKCVLCGENISPAESSVPYKGKYAHQHCFDAAMKEINQQKKATLAVKAEGKKKTGAVKKQKPQALLKDGMSEEEYAKKKKYYAYLKTLIPEEELSVKQLAVSERYIDHYNFTFEGMYQTLVYLNEILQKELKGDVVGIIPYYYSEAEQFNQELKNIEDNNKKINWSKYYPKKIIQIKPQKRKIKELDIASIGEVK